jgi:hypothetical protein
MDALPRFDRDPRSSGVMVYSRPGVAPGHYQYMRLSSIGEFKQSPNHSNMLISVQAIGDACTRFPRFAVGPRRRRKQLCIPYADGFRRLLVGAAAEGARAHVSFGTSGQTRLCCPCHSPHVFSSTHAWIRAFSRLG